MILFCPVLCCFVNFIIGSCADDDYQHFCPDQLIYDTDTGISELDFQESIKIIALFISQQLSIAALCNRQRILKDSHCGAFAVICMVLLALAQWSVFLQETNPAWLPLLLIPAATRACAGLAVMHLRPMGTSQYAAMRRGGADLTAALWIFLALAVGLPIWLAGSFAPLAAAVGYGLAAWYGFRQLDGMSGDISGFALTVGELGGAATLLYVG